VKAVWQFRDEVHQSDCSIEISSTHPKYGI
jgi:hypothetical protein